VGNPDIRLKTAEPRRTDSPKLQSKGSILSQKRINRSRNQTLKSMYST
jgi:hypothetical protein